LLLPTPAPAPAPASSTASSSFSSVLIVILYLPVRKFGAKNGDGYHIMMYVKDLTQNCVHLLCAVPLCASTKQARLGDWRQGDEYRHPENEQFSIQVYGA
jgi:hypothetical protein